MKMVYKRNASKRSFLILCFIVFLLCLSICYAYLSKSLKLNAVATIDSTMWDVHFENISISEGSIEGTPEIGSDKTSISFSFMISEPGDFYEFYVDVVNTGSINARVESLIKTNFTEEQSHYLTFHVTYEDGVDIEKGDILRVGEKERIKVLVQFNRSINVAEISFGETINLDCQINYVQDEGIGMPRKRKVLASVLSSVAESDANINFGATSSDTNGLGVYKLTKIEKEGEPIYYYRGDVKNNNVLFANFCWKMLRTTETGGIKLIYNGIPNNGVCNNIGESTGIGMTNFNNDYTNPEAVGYMYDNNTKDSTIKTIVDTWFANNLVGYLEYIEDTPFYNERDYVEGEGFPRAYAPRMRVWGNFGYGTTNFGEAILNTTIKLGAQNKEDIFTVSSEIGNGALTYPVGLITSDEVIMAGGRGYVNETDTGINSNFYLYIGDDILFWTISPFDFYSDSIAHMLSLKPKEALCSTYTINVGQARPVISLQAGTTYSNGDGTINSPYIITE